MKNKIVILVLLLSICICTACGSNGLRKSTDDSGLSPEFTLEPKELEGVSKLESILFAKEVTKVKVSSLGPDKQGMALGYSLTQEETEKLITLFQKEDMKVVDASQEKYNSTAMRDKYGYTVEFVDSMDKFYPGASRLTCFTTTDENYLAVIDENGGTKFYKIELTEDIIDFLNNASKTNYKASKGRGGWFDKVFN